MAAIRLRPRTVAGVSPSVGRGRFALVLASSLWFACAGPTERSLPVPNRSVMARASCDGLGASDLYVPLDYLVPRGELIPGKPSLREAYSELLRAMGEPSLLCGPVAGVTIRVGILPWTGAPAIARLNHSADRTDATVVKLEAPTWNFPPGDVLERRTQIARRSDWVNVQTALGQADVWNLETTSDMDKTDVDGTTWIFEIRDGSSYQIVSRANPTDDALHRVSELVLRIANLSPADLSAEAPGVRVRPFRRQPWMPPAPPPEAPEPSAQRKR